MKNNFEHYNSSTHIFNLFVKIDFCNKNVEIRKKLYDEIEPLHFFYGVQIYIYIYIYMQIAVKNSISSTALTSIIIVMLKIKAYRSTTIFNFLFEFSTV